MWKREEASKPVVPPPSAPAASGGRPGGRIGERDVVNIGKSVIIKGELSGSEDLTIEGHVEGKIELKQHVLTIGPNGRIRAEIFAKAVVVLGEVIGNIGASEKVAIRDNGGVEGDITAPKVAIAEGARFRGGIDMQQGAAARAEKAAGDAKGGVEAKADGAKSSASGKPAQPRPADQSKSEGSAAGAAARPTTGQ